METNSQALRDLADVDIEALVQSLNSLHEGELGVDIVVACGERAIEPLRIFLLQGKPSGIFLPRQRAVRALAQLGATGVLLDYLVRDERISDPVAAHGEEAVKNAAARALGAWQTEEVYQALRRTLMRKRLVGVIDALGEFRRQESVPDLIGTLEDDFCRSSAEDALRKMGALAYRSLIDAATTPHPYGMRERPASQRRRRCVLRLLEYQWLSADDWSQIRGLLCDEDLEISARASAIALMAAYERDKTVAVRTLIAALPRADWLLQGEIEAWLEKHLDVALPGLTQEINQRLVAPTAVQAKDNVLRILLGLRRKAKDLAGNQCRE
jgi:hypothetical protein